MNTQYFIGILKFIYSIKIDEKFNICWVIKFYIHLIVKGFTFNFLGKN